MDSRAPDSSRTAADDKHKNAEGCWKCGSPLHHRSCCTENISLWESAETRREIKRLQDAFNPSREVGVHSPLGFSIKELDFFLNKSDQFYYDMDIKLTEIGRPTIDEPECGQIYVQHRKLNLAIHSFRRSDDKMCSSLRKCPRSYFSSVDQYELFMGKVESVHQRRALVWEKSCQLLVWSKMAIRLSMQWKSIRDGLRLWMKEAKTACNMGRPEEIDYVLVHQVSDKLKQLDRLQEVLAELRKICKPDLIPRIDEIQLIGNKKVKECIAELHCQKNKLDRQTAIGEAKLALEQEHSNELRDFDKTKRRLEREKESLNDMVMCTVCMDRAKEMVLPCGHMMCTGCIEYLELHSTDPTVLVVDGQGIDGQQLPFYETATKRECPQCGGPLRPRRRIFFN